MQMQKFGPLWSVKFRLSNDYHWCVLNKQQKQTEGKVFALHLSVRLILPCSLSPSTSFPVRPFCILEAGRHRGPVSAPWGYCWISFGHPTQNALEVPCFQKGAVADREENSTPFKSCKQGAHNWSRWAKKGGCCLLKPLIAVALVSYWPIPGIHSPAVPLQFL